MPENSIYRALQGSKPTKKNSQVNLQSLVHEKSQQRLTKKLVPEASPKLKIKKGSFKKIGKVMSEEKKVNYNIDVKLNINLKINEKIHNKLEGSRSKATIKEEPKLPEIKNNSKILKYRLSNAYPGKGLNTIYNSHGNLSVLGETKEIAKPKKI